MAKALVLCSYSQDSTVLYLQNSERVNPKYVCPIVEGCGREISATSMMVKAGVEEVLLSKWKRLRCVELAMLILGDQILGDNAVVIVKEI